MTIPRRLSVRDPGYDYEQGQSLTICLDGIEQSKVIAYDIDAGQLTRYVTDQAGRIMLNETKDAAIEETLHGLVAVGMRSTDGSVDVVIIGAMPVLAFLDDGAYREACRGERITVSPNTAAQNVRWLIPA